MTLKQIEKIREAITELEKLKENPTPEAISKINNTLENFFHESFKSPYMYIDNYFSYDTYVSEENMRDDISNLISTLEGMIAVDENAPLIIDILSLIEEGEKAKKSTSMMEKYISKVYYSYSGRIEFDAIIGSIANASQEVLGLDIFDVTKEMIDGIITKLKTYAYELSLPKQIDKSQIQNNQEINFQPQIHVESKSETNINIEVVFKTARQKVSDEGLSDAQAKELLDKINELELLSKSSESKGSKWTKIKETMKWLVEQGISVAGILMPVMTQVLQQEFNK